jgi:hypothetical protein
VSGERDEFSQNTKRLLQGRVANLCSNPACRKNTSGPNADNSKVSIVGVAAHISAAAQGGPRFNSLLTTEDRKDFSNGIWLCQNCARLIDVDAEIYNENVLVEWKIQGEAHARKLLERSNSSLEIQPENMEGQLSCPHCNTPCLWGQSVCAGCQAEIYYQETPQERELWARSGCGLGLVIGLLCIEPITHVLQVLFPGNQSNFAVITYYLIAILGCSFIGLISGYFSLKKYVVGRDVQFVRYSLR